MIKMAGIIVLILFALIIFVSPVRNYWNKFLQREKTELSETQIIGTVSGRNPLVEEIQKILKDEGLYPGPVDGIMGKQTRKAIKEFQKTKGLNATGKIDLSTNLALKKEKGLTKQFSKKEPDTILSSRKTMPLVSKDAKAEVEAKDAKKKVEIQDEIMSYRSKSKDRVKQIQTALQKAGFYRGEIDGKLGAQTKRAIIAFQKSKGLKPDGVVGPRTWEALEKYLPR